MNSRNQHDESLERIRSRAKELLLISSGPDTGDAETLAAFLEGTSTLDEIPEATARRWIDLLGADTLISDRLQSASESLATSEDPRPSRVLNGVRTYRDAYSVNLASLHRSCVDPKVGKILAGLRYYISGLAPEVRNHYENHFAVCEHCRSWRQIHQIIDVGLIVSASVSAGVFLLALGVSRYLGRRHAAVLEIAALAGFALSALIRLGVARSSPTSVTMRVVAKQGAQRVHDKLPEKRTREALRLTAEGHSDDENRSKKTGS